MRQQIFKSKTQKICVAEFTPTPTFEKMLLSVMKDMFVKQPDELYANINTKVGGGVQFADALL